MKCLTPMVVRWIKIFKSNITKQSREWKTISYSGVRIILHKCLRKQFDIFQVEDPETILLPK